MRLINVLDIDLDFFLSGVSCKSELPGQRLDSSTEPVWPEQAVKRFLEVNTGLSLNDRKPGKYFINHQDVFPFVRNLVLGSKEKLMFHFDHVDGHSDFDNLAGSMMYIFLELLRFPRRGRMYPKKKYLNEGNFLNFMAAAEWLYSLNHISLLEEIEAEQYNRWYFKNYDLNTNRLKLESYSVKRIPDNIDRKDKFELIQNLNPDKLLKDIPFNHIYYKEFNSNINYDYIFLTQSPEYTPETSDALIPIIKEYMQEI
jgi:hypothetical protein